MDLGRRWSEQNVERAARASAASVVSQSVGSWLGSTPPRGFALRCARAILDCMVRGLVMITFAGCVTSASEPQPAMDDSTRVVHVAWTNDYESASAANCYAHPELTVRFRAETVGGEVLAYAPVPCVEGLFTARDIPARLWIAEVATIESAMGVPIDADGFAMVNLDSRMR